MDSSRRCPQLPINVTPDSLSSHANCCCDYDDCIVIEVTCRSCRRIYYWQASIMPYIIYLFSGDETILQDQFDIDNQSHKCKHDILEFQQI